MKIYTKKGDSGQTSLYRGGKVSKDTQRVMAYGTVDELNSQLGLVRALGVSDDLVEWLHQVQNDLFTMGADLATPPAAVKAGDRVTRLSEDAELFMEAAIDGMEERLQPLENFILPGGTEVAASLHVARSVCRRGEREVVTLAHQEEVNPVILRYLNRLSDMLFVAARFMNMQAGRDDVKWG